MTEMAVTGLKWHNLQYIRRLRECLSEPSKSIGGKVSIGARGEANNVPCLDHLEKGTNRLKARHYMGSTCRRIGDRDYRPREGKKLFEGFE